ncbi:MAG: hypothetical protein ACTSVI_01220 [Promethearchaeota archaeon]
MKKKHNLVKDGGITCDRCGRSIAKSDITTLGGKFLCKRCLMKYLVVLLVVVVIMMILLVISFFT